MLTKTDKYASLRQHIITRFNDSFGSAGQRTLVNMLSDDHLSATRFIVRKIMKEEGLVSCQIPRHKYPKGGNESLISPNLLKRKFDVTQPNRWWCGDITYIWTHEGWCYLAAVMDLSARRIVGYAMSKKPDSHLVNKAFNLAYASRGKPKNLVFHSDQGCQYSSHDFRENLQLKGVQQSMSRRGNCWDNAPMERFFRSYKTERMPRLGYEKFDDAIKEVSEYIECYYNTKRSHTYNGGLSPVAAEKQHEIPETIKIAA